MPLLYARQSNIILPRTPRVAFGGSLARGLKHYWPLNESGGAKAFDAANPRDTIAFDANAQWYAGKKGRAISFDGTYRGTDSNFNWPGGPITIAYWQWVDSGNLGSNPALVGDFTGASGNRLILHSPYSDSTFYWDYGGSGGSPGRVSVTYTPYMNKWTFVTVVSTGSSGSFQAIYFNAILAASAASAADPGAANTTLYFGAYAGGGYYRGRVQAFRIWSRVLSLGEIRWLYDNSLNPITPFRRYPGDAPAVMTRRPLIQLI